jgi:hypothetical protein
MVSTGKNGKKRPYIHNSTMQVAECRPAAPKAQQQTPTSFVVWQNRSSILIPNQNVNGKKYNKNRATTVIRVEKILNNTLTLAP